jgi:uncharacterized protein YqeY
LTNEQTQAVIGRVIKKLDKEMESYVAVGRATDAQETEKALLLTYLPKQFTEQEIRDLVAHAVSLVMRGEIKHAMPYLSQELKGKADMGLVARIVKEFKN